MGIISLMLKKDLMKFFLIKKNNNTLGIEGSYLNIIKTTYETLTANILLNGKGLKSRTRQGCSFY